MLYLTFLEEKKQYKKLLVTLKKYCGFFLNDQKMLGKYEKALIQFVLWKKEFESADLQNDTKAVGNENDETNEQSNKNIRDNFFDSYCYRLSIGSSVVFENDSLTITPSSNPKLFFRNSVIGGCIFLERPVPSIFASVPSTIISKLIPRLSCCTAKFIDIRKQNLSFVELQFLIKYGGVVHLDMHRCEIRNENGDYIALEDIMKHLPHIEELSLPNIRITSKTARALAKQKFYNKLRLFRIDSIYGEPLDATLFLKFLKENLDEIRPGCYFRFNRKFNDVAVTKFSEVMKDYVQSQSGISKPSISVYHGKQKYEVY
uniref:FBD domain-containing protein n=1 Tax=Panagrolaimus sp. PS1159 TaxID=55785 RepID=A0AC35F5U7_9BILA